MSGTVIQVEGLGKRYRLGILSHQSLRKDIQSRWARFRGKDDPNSCVVDRNGRGADTDDDLWALKDVSFEVDQGDVVGIVGRNGAGKSTVLKILSRVTTPTEGVARLKGHVASLLEVGTGFHPELTGRENVFLNGAILGMRRGEIDRKLDEIVSFAEVDRFVDTPVKRYSSGMYVRLAFAVAAHLDPEILIVDEVLAVGDIQFQRKCLGKMGSVARSGRTVLFVSHNLGAVRSLCSRALLFERGRLTFDGAVEDGLASYERTFSGQEGLAPDARFSGSLSEVVRVERLACIQAGHEVSILDPLSPFRIELHGVAVKSFSAVEIKLSLFRDGLLVTSCFDAPPEPTLKAGKFLSSFDIPANVFLPGRYAIGVGAVASRGEWMWGSDVAALEFADKTLEPGGDRSRGVIEIPYSAQRAQ
jgi:lipopolysaccharide transport system ATP-binding protein